MMSLSCHVISLPPQSQYIRDMGLAGGMIWALDLDDFRNRCGQGNHPLLSTIKSVLGAPKAPGYVDSKPAHHPEIITRVQGPPNSKKCFNSALGTIKSEVANHPPIQEEHFLPEVPGVRPPPGVPVCAKKCWDPDLGVIVMEMTKYPPGRLEPVVERVMPVEGAQRPPGMEECKCWDPNKGVTRTNIVDHPPIQPDQYLPEVPGVRPPPGVERCKPGAVSPSGAVSPPGSVSSPGSSSLPDRINDKLCWDPNKGVTRINAVNHPPIQPDQSLPEVPGVRPPPGMERCKPGTVSPPGSVSSPGSSSLPDRIIEKPCWNPIERMNTETVPDHPPIQPDQFLPEVPGVRPKVCPPGTREHPPPPGEL